MCDQYQVVTYTAKAPKSGGGKYRRPVHVSVIFGDRKSARRYCKAEKTIAENVDSRYDGPKSAFGRAMRAAQEYADSMNKFLGV